MDEWESKRWNYIQENDLPNSCYFCKGLGFNCWSDPCPKSNFTVDNEQRINFWKEHGDDDDRL